MGMSVGQLACSRYEAYVDRVRGPNILVNPFYSSLIFSMQLLLVLLKLPVVTLTRGKLELERLKWNFEVDMDDLRMYQIFWKEIIGIRLYTV
jgi:hypothetical protein